MNPPAVNGYANFNRASGFPLRMLFNEYTSNARDNANRIIYAVPLA